MRPGASRQAIAMLILHLSIVLMLIIVNSVFAMAEIALVSARKARLVPLAEAGNRGAQAALELKADPSRLLSTVQIGVTLIAVLSGTFGEATLGNQLERQLGTYTGFAARYAHVISMAVVVIGISYFSLILGELVPKRIALLHPDRIAAALGSGVLHDRESPGIHLTVGAAGRQQESTGGSFSKKSEQYRELILPVAHLC